MTTSEQFASTPGVSSSRTLTIACVLAALTSCKRDLESSRGGGAGSGTGADAQAETQPTLLDPNTRDPLELMQVAETFRAKELLALAESDDPKHTAALLALTYSDDVELALGRLSEMALDAKRNDRETVLTVLRDIAYRRPNDRERLAPESLAACISNLRRLADDEREEAVLRALAGSSVNAFARNSLVRPLPAASSVPSVPSLSSATAAPTTSPPP